MLPRAEAPARRLPYTTADMAERLAKRKAEQDAAAQAQANQALRFGVTNPPVQEDKGGGGGLWPSWKELGNAAKIGVKGGIGMVNTVAATPIDIADEAVQGLERLVGVTPTDKFDPASVGSFNAFGEAYRGVDRAANYVAGQIAATPGVGKPSSSPFMDTVRSRGWAEAFAEPIVHAVNVGSVAYPLSKMAVGAKLPGTIADTYRQRLLERDIAAQNNLFPTVQRPANVIDVDALQGSRLPARVVDSPATPATRLAQAQTKVASQPKFKVIRQTEHNTWNNRAPIGYTLVDANNEIVGIANFRIEDGVPKLDQFFIKPGTPMQQSVRAQNLFASIDKDILNYLGQNNSIGATRYNIDTSISQSAKDLLNKLKTSGYEFNFNADRIPKDVGNEIVSGPSIWNTAVDSLPPNNPLLQTDIELARIQKATPAPASRLTPPAFRERPVPASSRLTVEFAGGKNPDGTPNLTAGQDIIIRSFDQKTGEYTGAITIYYDPFSKQATVNGLGATNPFVTPQLIAAAGSEVRKLVGDVKYPLTPDTSLSSTSRPFVERLQQAGLIDPAYKLPAIDNLNSISKLSGPKNFAEENPYTVATVIDPLSYQPGYNEVLKALIESKRQAKLVGEYGRLNTPSSNLTPERVAERLERELAQSNAAHLKTILEPVETITSTEFPRLSPKYVDEGGIPDPTAETRQAISFPVYEIAGEKIAFGNPDLGRFAPEFNNQNVQFIPIDPYRISGLDKTSAGGQRYAELMFDAHQGLVFEQGGAKNIGQVSALTYAASRGDNVAFNELKRLADVGKQGMEAARRAETERILSFHKDWSNPNYWDQKSTVQIKLGTAKDGYTEIKRPMGIDDMFLVHQTDYAPTFDANGNIILKPTGDYAPIDPVTGQPMVDKISGKPVANYDRDNLHFTINHLVEGHMWRNSPTSNSNVIIVPLRDVLDANPGSLDNLYAIDTFLTPKPGEGLVIPMTSGKVLYQGQFQPGEFNDAINAALQEIGKKHNKLPEYQTRKILGGSHYANTEHIDERIQQVALQELEKQYPEYVGGVGGVTHSNHPSYFAQRFDNFDLQGGRGWLTGQDYWRMSPNQKLRIYDSNSNKYTTGELKTTYEPDYFGL